MEKLEQLEKRLQLLESGALKQGTQRLNPVDPMQTRPLEVSDARLSKTEPHSQVAGPPSAMQKKITRLSRKLEQTSPRTGEPGQAETLAELKAEIHNLIGEFRQTVVETTSEPDTETRATPALEISGFGDFTRTIGRDNQYQIGQVELNLKTTLEERVTVKTAIVYDGEKFGLGSFTADFRLYDQPETQPSSRIETAGIILGQFDVPFGIDWHEYGSINRKLISGPLAVEHTHEGWNDRGVQAYLASSRFNAVAYATNGFTHEHADQETSLALGSRVGIKVLPHLEVGGSYAGFFNGDSQQEMALWSADLHLSTHGFSLQGEYITQRAGMVGDHPVTHKGFYGLGTYDFGRAHIAARYDGSYHSEDPAQWQKQLSFGGGWRALEQCEFRIEHQIQLNDHKNTTILQSVVGF